MRRYKPVQRLGMLLLSAVMIIGAAFVSEASALSKKEVPVSLNLDINNRQTSIYNGYTAYVLGNRASEKDTFTITKDTDNINLDDVIMNYYLITYNEDTEKYLECTVYGLEEGRHYPVLRPETVAREQAAGKLYDYVNRCYVVEFVYKGKEESLYFMVLPEEEMQSYRNLLLGKWKEDLGGWRYLYQDEYLTSWAKINDKWYLFDGNGYMKTGWQQYKGDWYYLNPSNGVMQSNCQIDGHELDGSGIRIS